MDNFERWKFGTQSLKPPPDEEKKCHAVHALRTDSSLKKNVQNTRPMVGCSLLC